jgi:hypothetical protein
VPLAAVLAASTAWAGANGKLPEVWHHVAELLEAPRDRGNAGPHVPSKAPVAARVADEPARPTAASIPTVSIDDLPRVPDVAPPHVPPRAPVAAPSATVTPPPPEAQGDADADAELTLYAAAHRAHFVDHDPKAALDAWDAYLASAPDGRFAPEARYNRAIALLRLGRRAEAREALLPFADAAPGSYRQAEARELVSAIERGTKP